MYLTYIIIAFLLGVVIGMVLTQYLKELKHTVSKFYKTWTFKHKAIHPYKPQDKD